MKPTTTVGSFVTNKELQQVIYNAMDGFLSECTAARKAVSASPELTPVEVVMNDTEYDLPQHWAAYLLGQLAFQLKKHGELGDSEEESN